MSVFTLAVGIGLVACSPHKDTTPPGAGGACTEEAKVCDDGSTVAREGSACEFAACPGAEPGGALDENLGEDASADADAASEPEPDADAEPDAAE